MSEESSTRTMLFYSLNQNVENNTGLPTKNENLKTTVRNLYCLFPSIYVS